MNDGDWDAFDFMIQKIMRLPGSWQEKRDEVRRQIERRDADWEEFESWFQTGE